MAFRLLPVIFCLLLCAACAAKHAPEPVDSRLPRANPAYLQWLQKQSMLSRVPELVGQVSQTERVWLNNRQEQRTDVLLNAAPTWFEFNAHTLQSPLFRSLQHEVGNLAAMNAGGIYLGPLGEKPEIWLKDSPIKNSVYGEEAASLEFDQAAGSEGDFAKLAQAAEQAGLQLGSDLLYAAAGYGPDFILQARHATGFSGLYAMLEAPKEIWPELPAAKNEWDFKTLDTAALQKLVDLSILPQKLSRDSFSWTLPGGWAVTGEIAGSDGNIRRWLYRYQNPELRPVFLWQDPSGLARQIFSAAIIQSTGLHGQTLTGLHLAAWFGLEPAPQTENDPDGLKSETLNPGLAAINDLSGQIHSYGGWALQADPLPPAQMAAVLNSACDFCRDEPTSLLLAYALVSEDCGPLADLYRQWLAQGLDQSRLARGFNSQRGWQISILNSMSGAGRLSVVLGQIASGKDFITLQDIGKALAEKNFTATDEFFLHWLLGLPGPVFVDSSATARAGIPARLRFDGIMQSGLAEKGRLSLEKLRHLLGVRKRVQLARASLVNVYGRDKCLALLFRLPAGGYWLQAANFGHEKSGISCSLPTAAKNAEDAATGEYLNGNGRSLVLDLDVRQVKNVVIYTD